MQNLNTGFWVHNESTFKHNQIQYNKYFLKIIEYKKKYSYINLKTSKSF